MKTQRTRKYVAFACILLLSSGVAALADTCWSETQSKEECKTVSGHPELLLEVLTKTSYTGTQVKFYKKQHNQSYGDPFETRTANIGCTGTYEAAQTVVTSGVQYDWKVVMTVSGQSDITVSGQETCT